MRVIKSPDELKHALRVHLGMVKEENGIGDELAEFRQDGSNNVASSTAKSASSAPVREDLVVSSQNTKAPAAAASSDEDVLADDEFMKELSGM